MGLRERFLPGETWGSRGVEERFSAICPSTESTWHDLTGGLSFHVCQMKIIMTVLFPSQPCLGMLRGDYGKCFVNCKVRCPIKILMIFITLPQKQKESYDLPSKAEHVRAMKEGREGAGCRRGTYGLRLGKRGWSIKAFWRQRPPSH